MKYPLAFTLLLAFTSASAATTSAQCAAQKDKARDACYKTLLDEKCGALQAGARPTMPQLQCRARQMQTATDDDGLDQRVEAVKACKTKAKKPSQANRCEKLMDP